MNFDKKKHFLETNTINAIKFLIIKCVILKIMVQKYQSMFVCCKHEK